MYNRPTDTKKEEVGQKMSVAVLLGSLSSNTRLEIISALGTGGLSVNEVCERVRGTQANVSQHLKILRNVGILSVEQRKNQRIYRVKDQKVTDLINLAKSISSPAEKETPA